ncbi:MAG: PEP-CTERM sorting domain-containing protein [Bryobacteraceae bacterium]
MCLAARPSIIINSDPPGPITITGPTFSFISDSNGGGDFSFINGTGVQWFSLDIFVNLPQSETLICGPGPFGTCGISTANGPNGTFNYDITMGPAPVGITPDQNFSIDLNDSGLTNTDPAGSGSWGPNTQFNARINDVPEPASWGLCGLALAGALLLGRRRFRASGV